MEPLEKASETCSTTRNQIDTNPVNAHLDPSLIPGLPDDLALLCFSRIPRRYHHILKCVSKRWRALLQSEDWYTCRQKLGLAEAWVYAICRDSTQRVCSYVLDPTIRRWRRLCSVPTPCLNRYGMACEVLGPRLYLLGGCGMSEEESDQVFYYNALSDNWEESASLATPRSHFVCEALDGKLHAVGGMGVASGALHSWETYNPHLNAWDCIEDPNVLADIGDSVTFDGKIYVRHVSPSLLPDPYASVYDPMRQKWDVVNDEMVMRWQGPTVVVDGKLYMLDQTVGIRLMMWDGKAKEWTPVGRLSTLVVRPPCKLAQVGKSLFVIGKGLSTVVLDMEAAGRVSGIMVGSSVTGIGGGDDLIFECKVLAI